MSYFVQLTETNTTLNLEQIASIEWDCISEELEGTNYTTTVSLASGSGYYLTRNDARALWKAIQRYNQYTQSSTYSSHPTTPPAEYDQTQTVQQQVPQKPTPSPSERKRQS